MRDLTINILKDLGLHWQKIIDLPDIARKHPIYVGDFILAFLEHQKYSTIAGIFDIHVDTVSDAVDMIFPDKGEAAIVYHNIWF